MSEFPNVDNVDVYKYKNDFDYARWKPDTRLKLCNVPWCGDYDNVVKFEGDSARDAYLESVSGETVTMNTMFHVKPDGSVKVPVPITSAQKYNYLVVDIPRPTSDAQPIEYASGERKSRFMYFITDARQLSPSTTQLSVQLDFWQTYINDMRFDYIMLERGHAPVAASPVSAYLQNPRENADYLLCEDVNTGGEPYVSKTHVTRNYSSADQWACIAMNADLHADAGSKSAPKVPAVNAPTTSGAPAPIVHAVAIGDLQRFLTGMQSETPWLKQCVLGVFFIPRALTRTYETFERFGVQVHTLDSIQRVNTLMQPSETDFRYPDAARRFAKLYTWPYAAIRVIDETGAASYIRVEDLDGDGLRIADTVNLIMPYISIQARFINIAGVSDSLTFHTENEREYAYGGAWGDFLKSWNVPVMQVTQSAYDTAYFNNVYNRAHARLSASNALASSLASNATAQTNAYNSARNIVNNNAVAVAANNQALALTNTGNLLAATNSTVKMNSDTKLDNETSAAATEVQNETIALTTANNAATGLARTIGNVATGALLGGVAGAAGAALMSGMDTAINVVSANASAAISQSSNTQMANIARSNATGKAVNANTYVSAQTSQGNTVSTQVTNVRNDASTSTAQNNSGVITTNADNSKTTGDANANRTNATALDAIEASTNSAGMAAPNTFGATASGQMLGCAPRMLTAQVVTQRACNIMDAASAFARYGYALMREWDMREMQVMKYFTYWKCAEVWCSGEGDSLEGAQAAIRDILIRGVTVWSNPDKIGKVSVYDNFID